MPETDPQPISLEDAQRGGWALLKQKKPLSAEDQALVEQQMEWQMFANHGIRL